MSKNDRNKIKDVAKLRDWALKTGLPLENEVEQTLQKAFKKHSQTTDIRRESTFPDRDSEHNSILRSVDFIASLSFAAQTIPSITKGLHEQFKVCFVVEAKYSSEDIFWFIPSQNSYGLSSLIPRQITNEPAQKYSVKLANFVSNFKANNRASRGTKIRDVANNNDITSYIVQVVGALKHEYLQESNRLGVPHISGRDYYRNATVFVPIVVVSSPIYLLKANITTEEVTVATDGDKICSEVDSVFCELPNLRHMIHALEQVSGTSNAKSI